MTMQVRQIKMIAQCCAFLVSCFCGEQSWAGVTVRPYSADITVDLIDKSAKDNGNNFLPLSTDSNTFTITLPKGKIADRKCKNKYEVISELNYLKNIQLTCYRKEEGSIYVDAKLSVTQDNVVSQVTGNQSELYVSPTLTFNSNLLKQIALDECSLNDSALQLKDLVNTTAEKGISIEVKMKISPYISITNKNINAELIKQDTGDYTTQVEIPVETNANNIKLSLSSCTYSDANTCQLKHEDIDSKVPIHIFNNDGNNEIKINEHISKSGFTNINNTFFLDLKTYKDDMNNAKAGKYAGKINLRLEASF